MKIRNSEGKVINVPKEHEQTVRELVAKGDHDSLTSMANGGWIKNAVNPAHKGFCSPMSKKTCTPRRKALAKRFKKGGDLHKAALGDEIQDPQFNPGSEGYDEQQAQQNQPQVNPITGQRNPAFNPALTSFLQTNYGPGKKNAAYMNPYEASQYGDYLNAHPDPNAQAKGKKPNMYNYLGLPYYAGQAEYGADDLKYHKGIKDSMGISNSTPKDRRRINTSISGDRMQIAGGVIGQVVEGVYDTVAPLAAGFHNMNVDMDEQAIRMHQKQNQAQINPYYGDSSQLGGGTRAAYAKYGMKLALGGKLGYLEYGGAGINNGTGKANIKTERGEVTNNTEQVFKEGGDLHSDSSGGNTRSYKPGTVVHSDSIGLTARDAVQMLPLFPGGDFAATKIQDEHGDSAKKLSFADMSKPFLTKDIDNKLLRVDKKIEKEDIYATSNNETKISRVTSQLNLKTLKKKAMELEQERQMNLAVTGPDGPLHALSEGLKKDGAYGKEIKDEATAQAKFGKEIPEAGEGDLVTDKYNKFISKGGKWYYYNGDQLGAELPADYRPDGADDYGAGSAGLSGFIAKNPGNMVSATPPVAPAAAAATPTWHDPSPAEYRKIAGMEWLGSDEPSAAQKAKGFKKGFNTGIDPKLLVGYLKNAGYTPPNGDWNQITEKDLQNHVYDWDTKSNNNKIKEYLYNEYLPTIQGQDWFKKKGYSENTPFYQLDPEDVDKVFKDEKLGVRFGKAAGLMGINKAQPQVAAKADDPADPYTPSTFKANTLPTSMKRKYYQEGLNPAQIAAPLMDLFASKQAVPYIEDQGAKRALAANTRQRFSDQQPFLNSINRGLQAENQFRGATPVDQARSANSYSNAYMATADVAGKKFAADAQIEQNYNNMQGELLMRAGANKAQALNTLAERTATRDWKDYALRRNAVGEIGNKYLQNNVENRTAALYQDMFPNYNYNPLYGGTQFQGSWSPQVGAMFPYGSPTTATNKGYTEEKYTDPETGHEIVKRVPTVKFGGKVKLPKKSPKQR